MKDSKSTYPIKVQVMRRKGYADRYYVNIPSAIAAAIGLTGDDRVEWELLDRDELHLVRLDPPPPKATQRATRKQL